jgi:manganese/zinc/iron transport system substrate-binding protein
MAADVDPHLYQASTGDVRILQEADAIIYSGIHLEGKMQDIFERMESRKVTRAVAAGIDPERLIDVGGGQHDPHIWFDVDLWSGAIGVVEEVLSGLAPGHAGDFHAAAAAYQAQLEELHKWCGEQIANIPEDRRVLVTAHDAFHYFGKAYGIEVRAIQGISTDSEAGLREINGLIDFIVERKVKAVFFETTVPRRTIEALVEGCKQRGHAVQIGGELYSDALGPAGSGADTYIAMVRHNVETIVRALQ